MISAQLPVLLGQAGGAGAGAQLALMAGIFVIAYFIMIRPQQKQAKEHQAMLGSLKKGDDVVTSGGLFGKIFAVTEKTVVLEVANGVRLKILKSSVQTKASPVDEAARVEEPAKKEEK